MFCWSMGCLLLEAFLGTEQSHVSGCLNAQPLSSLCLSSASAPVISVCICLRRYAYMCLSMCLSMIVSTRCIGLSPSVWYDMLGAYTYVCVCVSVCVMKGEYGERKHLPVCSGLRRGEGLKLRHQSVISSLSFQFC